MSNIFEIGEGIGAVEGGKRAPSQSGLRRSWPRQVPRSRIRNKDMSFVNGSVLLEVELQVRSRSVEYFGY